MSAIVDTLVPVLRPWLYITLAVYGPVHNRVLPLVAAPVYVTWPWGAVVLWVACAAATLNLWAPYCVTRAEMARCLLASIFVAPLMGWTALCLFATIREPFDNAGLPWLLQGHDGLRDHFYLTARLCIFLCLFRLEMMAFPPRNVYNADEQE